ncbi:hypothetical protein NLU13_8504 [Sarocladium strictum]|uniref:Uncharacterized protein n=1 Tax=Sarocladium strictum TaxID=5046 RepID=A0AA39GE66_SARSR|nr:hypothetical protein NLU13_8504 [Sarocladium strictum]
MAPSRRVVVGFKCGAKARRFIGLLVVKILSVTVDSVTDCVPPTRFRNKEPSAFTCMGRDNRGVIMNTIPLEALLRDGLALQEDQQPEPKISQQLQRAEEDAKAAKRRYWLARGKDEAEALAEVKEKTALEQELWEKYALEKAELEKAAGIKASQANAMFLTLISALVERLKTELLSQSDLQHLGGLVTNLVKESSGPSRATQSETSRSPGADGGAQSGPHHGGFVGATQKEIRFSQPERDQNHSEQMNNHAIPRNCIRETHTASPAVSAGKEDNLRNAVMATPETSFKAVQSVDCDESRSDVTIIGETKEDASQEPMSPISLTENAKVDGDTPTAAHSKKRALEGAPDESKKQKNKKRRLQPHKTGPWKPITLNDAYDGHRSTAVDEIEFDDVYQGGEPQCPHWICSHDGRSFYIFRCDEHGVTFNDNAAQGAAKHLRGNQHKIEGNNQTAYDVLSIRVLNCNLELQSANNTMMRRRLDKGFSTAKATKPARELMDLYSFNRKGRAPIPSPAENRLASLSASEEEKVFLPKPRLRLNRNQPSSIIPGEVYQGWNVHAWRPVVALPSGSFEQIGLLGSLEDTGLLEDLPAGVEFDPQTRQFYGKFSKDGSVETELMYPVMLFDGKPALSRESTVIVLKHENFQTFDRNASDLNKDLFAQEALKYLEGREKRKGATGPVFEVADTSSIGGGGAHEISKETTVASVVLTADVAVASSPESHPGLNECAIEKHAGNSDDLAINNPPPACSAPQSSPTLRSEPQVQVKSVEGLEEPVASQAVTNPPGDDIKRMVQDSIDSYKRANTPEGIEIIVQTETSAAAPEFGATKSKNLAPKADEDKPASKPEPPALVSTAETPSPGAIGESDHDGRISSEPAASLAGLQAQAFSARGDLGCRNPKYMVSDSSWLRLPGGRGH